MSARCEPPEELRGVDGEHFVCGPNGEPFIASWRAAPHKDVEPLWVHLFGFRQPTATPAWAAHQWGWRYLAPVATPAEVAGLRAEVERAGQACFDAQHKAIALKNQRDAIGIAFTKLSAVLRVNMLRHVPGTSHAEINAAIDACLGPVARAALTHKEPGDEG